MKYFVMMVIVMLLLLMTCYESNSGIITSYTQADGLIGEDNLYTLSNQLTLEALVKSSDLNQSGPARIISFSEDIYYQCFMLGQQGNFFEFRLVSTGTDTQAKPKLITPEVVTLNLQHIVITISISGERIFYLDGAKIYQDVVIGNFSNWKLTCQAIVKNEHGGQRPYSGLIQFINVYDTALTESEVMDLFNRSVTLKPPGNLHIIQP